MGAKRAEIRVGAKRAEIRVGAKRAEIRVGGKKGRNKRWGKKGRNKGWGLVAKRAEIRVGAKILTKGKKGKIHRILYFVVYNHPFSEKYESWEFVNKNSSGQTVQTTRAKRQEFVSLVLRQIFRFKNYGIWLTKNFFKKNKIEYPGETTCRNAGCPNNNMSS